MKQITIITEEPSTKLADVSSLLAARGINIESLDAETMGDHGILNLIVDRYDEALAVLSEAKLHPVTEDAIVIRIADEPGALAKISLRFKDAGISLRSVRILRRSQGWGLVAISTDRTEEALELVRDVRVS